MSAFEHSVTEIVTSVWDNVLVLPVKEEDILRLSLVKQRTLAGVVQITGAWEGAVALQCSEALVRRAATIMLGIPDDRLSSSDVEDTVGELGNMIGGNIKALLPEPCRLSLPMVIEGTDFRMRLPGATQVLQCGYSSDGQPFGVSLLQRVEVDARREG